MPKKKAAKDPEFVPGFTRRTSGFEPSRDNRCVSKQLLDLKCKARLPHNKRLHKVSFSF